MLAAPVWTSSHYQIPQQMTIWSADYHLLLGSRFIFWKYYVCCSNRFRLFVKAKSLNISTFLLPFVLEGHAHHVLLVSYYNSKVMSHSWEHLICVFLFLFFPFIFEPNVSGVHLCLEAPCSVEISVVCTPPFRHAPLLSDKGTPPFRHAPLLSDKGDRCRMKYILVQHSFLYWTTHF